MPEDIPTKKAMELQKTGKTNTEIIQLLQGEGYSFQQISEALNQAQAKTSIDEKEEIEEDESKSLQPSIIYKKEEEQKTELEEREQKPQIIATPIPPAPSPSQTQPQVVSYQPTSWPGQQTNPEAIEGNLGATTEDVEEITESIIDEKWQRLSEEFGDLEAWKEKINNDSESIKQELMRLENRFENLQNSVVGKISEYDQSVSDVGIEMKALGKLMSTIINPLTSNVKELQKLVKELKNS